MQKGRTLAPTVVFMLVLWFPKYQILYYQWLFLESRFLTAKSQLYLKTQYQQNKAYINRRCGRLPKYFFTNASYTEIYDINYKNEQQTTRKNVNLKKE